MLRIYTKAGDLPYTLMQFPDGQPHFELLHTDEFREVTIETDLCCPQDIFRLSMARQVLQGYGFACNLDIRYLMGARMDRAIDRNQPFTLAIVTAMINAMGFKKVRVLDCHSKVGTDFMAATNVLPYGIVDLILGAFTAAKVRVVIPDKGAANRVELLSQRWCEKYEQPRVQCFKERDMASGKLTNFSISDPSLIKDHECLIIDDICDGGGTFVGLAAELRKAGATKVSLFVTHGIFSKGPYLHGIDTVYTTDSYPHEYGSMDTGPAPHMAANKLVVFPIRMSELP